MTRQRLTRSAVAIALALALVSLAAPPATAAPAVTQATPIFGRLVSSTGADVDGVTVTLTAWAPAEELAEQAEGEETRSLAVAHTTTRRGGFILSYSNEGLESFADADGDISFTLGATVDGEQFLYSLTRSSLIPSADTEQVMITGFASPDATAPPVDDPGDDGTAGGATPIMLCRWVKLKEYAPRWVVVGDATTTTNATATFTYSKGATSTLGTAVSAKGTVGSFTVGGSTKISSTATITFPKVTGVTGRQFKTQFIFAKYGERCAPDPAGKYRIYTVIPIKFVGGADWVTQSIPSATYCTTYRSGSKYDDSDQKAATWTAGASLGSDIGINLSSQTGFDSKTKIHYDFAADKHLCGTNGYPPSAARLVAKP